MGWAQHTLTLLCCAPLAPRCPDVGEGFNCLSAPWQVSDSLGKPSPRQYISPSSWVPTTEQRSKALMFKRGFLPRSSKQLLCLILSSNTLGKCGDSGKYLGIFWKDGNTGPESLERVVQATSSLEQRLEWEPNDASFSTSGCFPHATFS